MDFFAHTYAEQFALHKWELEFDCGFFHLICKDPCDTYDCTPECATNTTKIADRPFWDEDWNARNCDCGQYVKFREAFERAGGGVCACMMTGEEKDSLAGTIPVRLVFVDDSTDNSWGGREYSHYVEVHPHVEA
jgi:hypothetical protein